MFTGIIEAIGKVISTDREGEKIHYWLNCPFTDELKLGESISHDGVCLTVTNIKGNEYSVTAIDTTLEVTNIDWQPEKQVNLERAMPANGRFDGHIVQGHVDTVGIVNKIEHTEGSVHITIGFEDKFSRNIIDKGSITVNGISLTIVEAANDSFSVAIIPHTWTHTNLHQLNKGNRVNLEFDVIGKYVARILSV